MPWTTTVRDVLPAGYRLPLVDGVHTAPPTGTTEVQEHSRQRLKFPRYVPNSIQQGHLVEAEDTCATWRKRYENYLTDELCQGVARVELCEELVNNIEGLAGSLFLDMPHAEINDEGNPDLVPMVTPNPTATPPVLAAPAIPVRPSGLDKAMGISDRYFEQRDREEGKSANSELDKFIRPHGIPMQSFRVHFEHYYYSKAHSLGGTTWSSSYKSEKLLEKARLHDWQKSTVESRVDANMAQYDDIAQILVDLYPMLTESGPKVSTYFEWIDMSGRTWYSSSDDHWDESSPAGTSATSASAPPNNTAFWETTPPQQTWAAHQHTPYPQQVSSSRVSPEESQRLENAYWHGVQDGSPQEPQEEDIWYDADEGEETYDEDGNQ